LIYVYLSQLKACCTFKPRSARYLFTKYNKILFDYFYKHWTQTKQ